MSLGDLQEAHPGMGLPTLTPQQAAMMQQGLAEMARMRRNCQKAQKHCSTTVTVQVSLEKLNSGCIKTVTRCNCSPLIMCAIVSAA